jgi:hypothetical protein
LQEAILGSEISILTFVLWRTGIVR